MNYKIETIQYSDKQIKKLTKKYPSLKDEFIDFVELIKMHPVSSIYLGNNCYKHRLKIKSRNKGKSSGVRIILH